VVRWSLTDETDSGNPQFLNIALRKLTILSYGIEKGVPWITIKASMDEAQSKHTAKIQPKHAIEGQSKRSKSLTHVPATTKITTYPYLRGEDPSSPV